MIKLLEIKGMRLRCVVASVLVIIILVLFSTSPLTAGSPLEGATPYKVADILARKGDDLSFLRTSLLAYAFQWTFVFSVNRGLGSDITDSNFQKWFKNVTTLPQLRDGDSWVTNYIGHPLMGASVYAFYRDRGFSSKQSIAGTFLQSTLFEYTVEGWKKPPSGVDLIVTPVVGSLIGSKVGMNSFILSSSYAISKYILGLF